MIICGSASAVPPAGAAQRRAESAPAARPEKVIPAAIGEMPENCDTARREAFASRLFAGMGGEKISVYNG